MAIKTKKKEYEMVGYSVMKDYPNIISGIIIQDISTDIEMRVSVREAQQLISDGKMDLPNVAS